MEGRYISELRLVCQINLEKQALPFRTRNRIHDLHPGRTHVVRPISSKPWKNTPSRSCIPSAPSQFQKSGRRKLKRFKCLQGFVYGQARPGKSHPGLQRTGRTSVRVRRSTRRRRWQCHLPDSQSFSIGSYRVTVGVCDGVAQSRWARCLGPTSHRTWNLKGH